MYSYNYGISRRDNIENSLKYISQEELVRENQVLETQADIVESVIDEYNALVEGEEENV